MSKPTVFTVLWMMFTWMLSMPVMAEEVKKSPSPLVETSVSPTRIDWSPSIEAQRWVMTLTGPDEFFLRREVKTGKALFLSIFDSEGDRLPNGNYNWELKAVSKSLASPRRQSGSFSIQDGSFVETPWDTGSGARKPPLQNTSEKVVDDDLIITGNGCIGGSCTNTDDDFSTLKLKSTQPNIFFDDIALPEGGPISSHDWALFVNFNDVDQFSIVDFTNARLPFSIAAGAPDNSLFIAGNGKLGVGTASPSQEIHVLQDADEGTRILIENLNTGLSASSALTVRSNSAVGDFKAHGSGRTTLSRFGQTMAGWGEFVMYEGNGLAVGTVRNTPLILGTNDMNRIHINGDGNIGIGTATPANRFHVFGNAGANKVLVQEASGTTTSRELLEIRNNGGTLMVYDDTSVPQRWVNGTLGSNFLINEQANAGIELALTNTGNLTITGVLAQGSSRDLKTDFAALDPQNVLAKVNALSVSTWRYKLDDPTIRHVGPTAEDFHKAFGLGGDTTRIAPSDQAGVALVAVQGLTQEVETLRRKNADLEQRIAALEALLAAKQTTSPTADSGANPFTP